MEGVIGRRVRTPRLRAMAVVMTVAAAAVAGVVMAGGIPGGEETSPTARWAASAAAARVDGPLTFPSQSPPGLIDVSFHRAPRLPPVGFFSASGEPTIAVCPATPEACRRFLTTGSVVAPGGTAPEAPTLLVIPGEPTTPPLSVGARRHWTTTDFTTTTPSWFPE